jgi:hypothetical protein
MSEIKINNIPVITENNGSVSLTTGTANIGNVNVDNINVSSSNHTWTLKGIDAPIGDSQTGTAPDTTNSDSGQLAIYNGATKLWGITEGGYVLNPKVPYFHVEKDDTSSYSSVGEIVFNVLVLDNTNGYSTSTGRFTVPVSGTYLLAFYGLKRLPNYINGGFAKNGSQYRQNQFYQYHVDSSEQNMVHISTLIELSAGDFASVRLDEIGGGDFYFGPNKHNGFLGYLLG